MDKPVNNFQGLREFIEIYKSWLESRKWAAQEELAWEDRVKLNKSDRAKNLAWNSLDQKRRKEIVAELIEENILPRQLTSIIDIFDARVIGI